MAYSQRKLFQMTLKYSNLIECPRLDFSVSDSVSYLFDISSMPFQIISNLTCPNWKPWFSPLNPTPVPYFTDSHPPESIPTQVNRTTIQLVAQGKYLEVIFYSSLSLTTHNLPAVLHIWSPKYILNLSTLCMHQWRV